MNELLIKFIYPLLSFALGNLTMFFLRRYYQAMPQINATRYKTIEQSSQKPMLVYHITFKPVAFYYTILRIYPSRPLYHYQDKGGASYVISTAPYYIEKQNRFTTAPITVQSHNITDEKGQEIQFCLEPNEKLYLNMLVKSAVFPYIMYKRELIIAPPH